MSGGVRTALDEVAGQLEGQAAPDQASLFDFGADEVGDLNAPSPLAAAIAPRKGPGRRPGSRNRRTDAVAGWLLSQGRHPVLVMMEAYGMEPAALAAKIGLHPTADGTDAQGRPCKVWSNDVLLDVYRLQLRMAESVAPYVAQRLPQAVQVDARAGVTIAFEGVNLPARGASPAGIEALDGEVMGVRLPFKSEGESRTDT